MNGYLNYKNKDLNQIIKSKGLVLKSLDLGLISDIKKLNLKR